MNPTRFVTVRNPQGPSTIERLPAPQGNSPIEIVSGSGWYHLPNVGAAPGKPFGKAARRMQTRAKQLVDYFGLPAIVLDDALVHQAGSNLRVCAGLSIGGFHRNWFIKGDLPSTDLGYFPVTQLVSGSCLFSAPAVRFRLADGTLFDVVGKASTAELRTPVVSIDVDGPLTSYEREAAWRLMWTLGQVGLSLLAQGRHVVIVLDLPMAQYYGYLLDGALNGLISGPQCLQWFDIVDDRCRRVTEYCRHVLRTVMGLHYDLCQVERSNELEDVADFLRDRIADGNVPSLQELVNVKLRSNDPIWKALLGLGLPKDIQTFNGRSYSAALLRHSTSSAQQICLGLEVDNISEGKILQGVEDAATANPAFAVNALAIYPVEQVFALKPGESRPGAYQNDPGEKLVFPDGSVVSMDDIIAELYSTPRP